jgi:DNA repair exonuclease SbcCD nuclease subunit
MTDKKAVSFIHTADWHIDNPFSLFDREMRKELKRALFRTVELIFRYAQKMEIPLILCAGDMVENGQLCAKEDILKLFEIIGKYPGIRLVMVTGDNDPLINRNIYSLLDKNNYPGNLYLAEGDEELAYPEWNLNIYAASIREKNGDYNPLNWIKKKNLDKEKINIGLCHGSIKNEIFLKNDFPIESDFAFKHGLDYLALGHRHSFKKINERTYYPGVPEPLQFNDEGFPLKVEIGGPGVIPEVEPIKNVRHYRWNRLEESITGESFEEFQDYIDKKLGNDLTSSRKKNCKNKRNTTALWNREPSTPLRTITWRKPFP